MRKVVKDFEGEEEAWTGDVGVPGEDGFVDNFDFGEVGVGDT